MIHDCRRGGDELRRLGFSAEWLRYVSQELMAKSTNSP